ncbi:MAG TPA: HAD-IA family hydrolase [bacterium]|nr:HAD-IA family hydrolase [bacterium]
MRALLLRPRARLRRRGGASYNAHMVPPERVALIFDMDNTLIGSRIDFAGIRRSLITLLRAAGATDDPDEALLRRAIPELVACGSAHDGEHGTVVAPEMWRIIEAHELAGLRNAAALDDAPAVLRTLAARGYRIAILTNNARAAAAEAIRAADLAHCAETLVGRGDVATLKPAGDGVLEVLRRLGGVDRTYVIGDSWIDGAAAAATGARFIAYRRPLEELRQRGVSPWRAIHHLSEMLELNLTD